VGACLRGGGYNRRRMNFWVQIEDPEMLPFGLKCDQGPTFLLFQSLGNKIDKRVWEDCGAEGRCVAPRRYLNPASVIKVSPRR